MSLILLFLALLGGFFTSWVIGVNNSSPFGPITSSGACTVFGASFIVGIASFLGSVTQGEAVANTVGKGLIEGVSFDTGLAAIVLLTASSLIIVSIMYRYPMPSVFTLVGSVIGAGLGMGGSLNASSLETIAFFWVTIPLFGIPLGFISAKFLRRFMSRDNNKKVVHYILLILGTYTAYTAGANRAGLAIGPLIGTVDIPMIYFLVFGGFGMLVGAWTGSPRIIEAIAREYSRLGPRRAIAALFTTGLLAQVSTLYGVPISFNEAIISAIIGAGLVEGSSSIGRGKITRTVTMWVVALFVSCLVSYSVVSIL
ncbi:MAG: anion permease [Candidatus Aenigmatarchaeota archaeon]